MKFHLGTFWAEFKYRMLEAGRVLVYNTNNPVLKQICQGEHLTLLQHESQSTPITAPIDCLQVAHV